MLRRADNVRLELIRDVWGLLVGFRYRPHLTIGKQTTVLRVRMTVAEYRTWIAASSTRPVAIARIGERAYWLHNGRWHWDNDNLSPDDVHAMLTMRDSRRTDSLNRAKSFAAMSTPPVKGHMRTGIPDDVKQLVWRRDGGACQKCGSNVEIQYDHVIPVSLGGSNGEANIQLLCGPCNRRKGASVV